MTVTTELSRSTFPWTGAETAFACNWPADKAVDVKVYFRTAAGITSEMTVGVNHDVTLANETNLVTILPIALPAAPGTLVVTRETPALVNEVLQDGEGFSLKIIQQLHDRAAMRSAEDRTRFARAIVLDEGAELGSGNFNLGGSGLSNLAPGVVPTDAATVGQLLDLIIASGNVPTPLADDIGKALVALVGGAFGWGQLDKAALVDGILSADDAGLAKFADGFLRATAGARAKMAAGFFAADDASLAKFADGFLRATAGARAKMADGFFAADAASRAKFADGFFGADAASRALFADKFLTLAKIDDVATATILGRKAAGGGPLEALSATEARELIAAIPQPQAGAGVGQVMRISPLADNGFNLPAGGQWEWWALRYAVSGNVYNGVFLDGISAGGTNILPSTVGSYWLGRARRVL